MDASIAFCWKFSIAPKRPLLSPGGRDARSALEATTHRQMPMPIMPMPRSKGPTPRSTFGSDDVKHLRAKVLARMVVLHCESGTSSPVSIVSTMVAMSPPIATGTPANVRNIQNLFPVIV